MTLRQLLSFTNEEVHLTLEIDCATMIYYESPREEISEDDLNHEVRYFESDGLNSLYVDISD